MGAADFSAYEHGKTAEEAFSAAVEHARYMDGHGGYTGTIAEKGSFLLLPALPPRWTAAKVQSLISTAEYGESYRAKNGSWKVRAGSEAKAIAALTGWLAGSRWTAASLLGDYRDKWGPALALEITGAERKRAASWANSQPRRGDRLFAFFGLASC